MSVKIARLRNGEDVICDLYEVTTKEEPEKAVAFQMSYPYSVWINSNEPPTYNPATPGKGMEPTYSENFTLSVWACRFVHSDS